MISIKKPIWMGGKIHLGLAEYRINQELNMVEAEILYVNKEGLRIFPNKYVISRVEALKYPRKEAGRYTGVWLRIIPLSAFKEIIIEKNTTKA